MIGELTKMFLKRPRTLALVSNAAFIILAAVGLFNVAHYAVDVPFWDEWEFILPDAFGSGFSWGWLWRQHNEHRIVLTKLENFLFFRLTDYNVFALIIVNYCFYVTALAMLMRLFIRRVPEIKPWVWTAFFVFLLSPRIYNNLTWAFQSQFHYAWAFATAAAALVFVDQPSPRRSLLGAFSGILAIVSLSGGLVEVAAISGVYTLFRMIRAVRSRSDATRELRDLALFVVPVGVTAIYWLSSYVKPRWHPPITLPFDAKFWPFFTNIVAWGFGFEDLNTYIGWACLAIVMLPLLIGFRRKHLRFEARFWLALCLVAATTASLAAISMGRADFFDASKSSRYAEFGQLLIPLSAFSWALVVTNNAWRRSLIAALWLFCAVALSSNFDFAAYMHPEHQFRIAGVKCAEQYYKGLGDGNCIDLYPYPIADRLDLAKALNLSFYQKLNRSIKD